MWNNGNLENKEAVVVSALDVGGSERFIATATVKLLPDLKEERVVPIRYLLSVQPKQGDKAVVLNSDAPNDTIFAVSYINGGDCYLTTTSLTYHVQTDQTIKYQECF